MAHRDGKPNVLLFYRWLRRGNTRFDSVGLTTQHYNGRFLSTKSPLPAMFFFQADTSDSKPAPILYHLTYCRRGAREDCAFLLSRGNREHSVFNGFLRSGWRGGARWRRHPCNGRKLVRNELKTDRRNSIK